MDVELFTNNIDAVLQNIDLSKKDVIILGDFNIDFLDKSSVDTKCINRLISGFGLTKLINSPTQYGATKNSCIDQIVTNSNHIYQTGVADLNISDHQLVYFVKKKNKDHPIKTTFEGRSYRNYNTHDMIHYLDLQDWGNFDQLNDPNRLWDLMLLNVSDSLDNICPLKNFKIKKYKEPWLSQELLELIKDKDIYLKKAKRTKLPNDWEIGRRYRNDCLAKIRKAKADFVKSELDIKSNDSKKNWKNIHDILPINNKANKKLLLSNPDSKEDINDADTAGYINDFFAYMRVYWPVLERGALF